MRKLRLRKVIFPMTPSSQAVELVEVPRGPDSHLARCLSTAPLQSYPATVSASVCKLPEGRYQVWVIDSGQCLGNEPSVESGVSRVRQK